MNPTADSLNDDPALDALSQLLLDQITARAWPGGILGIFNRTENAQIIPHGYHTYAARRQVEQNTVYDLASLTKVVATTTLFMMLVDAARVDLDQAVGEFLPEFVAAVPSQRAEREAVTIRLLLAHASGLPSYRPFYRQASTPPSSLRDAVLTVPLDSAPGTKTVYSDLGFMVLGLLAETVTGMPLQELFQRDVSAPLDLEGTRFCPPASWGPRIAPTEIKAGTEAPVHGVVHDENARFFGGVSGHAGLFATISDIGRFARMMLNQGELGHHSFVKPSTWHEFTRPAGIVPDSSRCLGWDGVSSQSSGGSHLHAGSFGHTGFTGTSLWIDPDADLAVALLTNAVHPRREDRAKHEFFARRRAIHTAVYELLGRV